MSYARTNPLAPGIGETQVELTEHPHYAGLSAHALDCLDSAGAADGACMFRAGLVYADEQDRKWFGLSLLGMAAAVAAGVLVGRRVK